MEFIKTNQINKKIILGTAQFGSNYGISNNEEKLTKNKVIKLLNFAQKKSINYLDVANAYKGYKKILSKINLRKWKISTKISKKQILKNNTEKKFYSFFYKQLKLLDQKKIEYFLFHNSADLLTKNGEKIYKILYNLKKENLIKKIGISIYAPNEIKRITNHYKIDIVQAPYNVFDQRIDDDKLLKKLKSKNIELHVRSIFLQGLLLIKKKKIPSKFSKWSSFFDKWYNFLDNNRTNALNECLNFVSLNKNISKYVVGVNSLNNLKDILFTKINLSKKNFDVLKSNDINLIDPRRW